MHCLYRALLDGKLGDRFSENHMERSSADLQENRGTFLVLTCLSRGTVEDSILLTDLRFHPTKPQEEGI